MSDFFSQPILRYHTLTIHLTCLLDRREDDQDNTADLETLTKYEDKHLGNFRRIYPEGNEEKYKSFFENSCSLFQETAASKARSECARIQREEIKQKGQEVDIMRKKNCGKRISADGVRPESPRPGRRVRRDRHYKYKDHVRIFNKTSLFKTSSKIAYQSILLIINQSRCFTYLAFGNLFLLQKSEWNYFRYIKRRWYFISRRLVPWQSEAFILYLARFKI